MAKYNSENGLGVGYSVEDGSDQVEIDPRLPLLQDVDLRDKVVLLRVDHNVVKKGKSFIISLPQMFIKSPSFLILRVVFQCNFRAFCFIWNLFE